MKPEKQLDTLLKPDFGKFFIVKVEDLIRLIKLPVPPARSTTHTFIYLTAGEAVMHIGSESYRIVQDECLVVPAGQVFSFTNLDINQGYLCNFHNDFMIGKFGKNDLLKDFEFLQVWGNPLIRLDQQTSGYVQHLLQRILLVYSSSGLGSLDLIQSYFIALLCEIRSVYQPLAGNRHSQSTALCNKFRELICANIRTMHLVRDYAALVHVSPNHLNKVVKQTTGKSPTRWIDETLVLEAKVLLHQTDLSIGEVAATLGLFDQSYFSRLFKKYEGVTPLAFRKRIEKS
jgi:AraC-like DNA-binding protein